MDDPMMEGTLDASRLAPERRESREVVPSAVLAILIFMACETMFFAGLISAFTIVKSTAVIWPPAGQPRLPIEETAINTAALLASAAVLRIAAKRYKEDPWAAERPFLAAMFLGASFVVLQGREWVALLAKGLTLTSSTLGSFFYLIVGAHGLHAIAALIVLVWAFSRLRRGRLSDSAFLAVQIFWYFVVGLWPLIYWRVYW
jgi:heme/copper-type cytochrome/quinol oxidase subunit 3